MPTVDFSLSDIQKLIDASEKRIIKHVDNRFDETHHATLDLFSSVLDQLDEHTARFDRMDDRFDRMDDRFDQMDDRFDRMDTRFDQLESEVKFTNRVVRGHSADISELRAR